MGRQWTALGEWEEPSPEDGIQFGARFIKLRNKEDNNTLLGDVFLRVLFV